MVTIKHKAHAATTKPSTRKIVTKNGPKTVTVRGHAHKVRKK